MNPALRIATPLLIACLGCSKPVAPAPVEDLVIATTPDPTLPPTPKIEPESDATEPEGEPASEPSPAEVCVAAAEPEYPCELLGSAARFSYPCEGTAAAVTPGPRADLRVLRIACAYGEELWTEEHAVVVFRELAGRPTTVWIGAELIQDDRQACMYERLVGFRVANGQLVIETRTTSTRTGDDPSCEELDSVSSETVVLD